MKRKTRTISFLVAGLLLLAGMITPITLADEGVWVPELTNPSFLYRLGQETRLTPSPECDSGEQGSPAVAHNYKHKEYLVVWENRWPPSGKSDIYARRVSESGEIRSWFCVTTGTEYRFLPALAYNATNDEYLVVWLRGGSNFVYEVWGRRITWNGANLHLPQYAEFKIFSWANRSFWAARVAWNGYRNEYLVAWSAFNPGTWVNTDVACKRVLADGSMPYGHLIVSDVGFPMGVDIVYNVALDGYLAVWASHGGATGYDIRGAFLDRTGAVITPPGEFDVYVGASDQGVPAVTTNEQNHYMVVWRHFDNSYSPGDYDIYGRLFQANGSPVTGPFMLSNTWDDERRPDVAANGATQQYLTVWTRNVAGKGIVVARLRNANGTLAATVDVLYARDGNPAGTLAVACDIPGFLIAYEKEGPSGAPYHIYGRLYWPEALYLPLTLKNH